MSSGFGYASLVAFGEDREVTLTGESLSQMQKEIGKSFYDVDFTRPYPPKWMNNPAKKMAASNPFHQVEATNFPPAWEQGPDGIDQWRRGFRAFDTGRKQALALHEPGAD